MAHDLKTAGANILATILGIDPKLAIGPALGGALRKLVDHRQQVALDILLEEIAAGQINPADVPPESLAAPVYRYIRAAREGAARLNLRLLARLIAGQASKQDLIADEFLYYADIIASLRREEIVLIATMYRHRQAPDLAKLEPRERVSPARDRTIAELVPSVFATTDDLDATCLAGVRTGLFTLASGWGGTVTAYLSPFADKVISMSSFEAAVEREAR